MNLILLEEQQLLHPTSAQLNSRQSDHLNKILKVKTGDKLEVGLVNGQMGHGRVCNASTSNIVLDSIQLDTPPSPTLPVTLLLALPRPQMIKRILQTVACMGVEKLCLLHSEKVEKSFWQSPSITDDAIKDQLILGLEQGKATQLPIIEKYSTFKAFSQNYLGRAVRDRHNLDKRNKPEEPNNAEERHDELRIIAHPGNYQACPMLSKTQKTVLAIGPESGFTNKEVDLFTSHNFIPTHLGDRILKVETAVTAILSRFI